MTLRFVTCISVAPSRILTPSLLYKPFFNGLALSTEFLKGKEISFLIELNIYQAISPLHWYNILKHILVINKFSHL